MGDDFVARPRGTVAKDDDFAVQEFDTGRGAGPRRPQAEVAPNRPVIERQWERICWGTEGSNPAPSSGESANDRFRDDFTGSTSRYPPRMSPLTSFSCGAFS